MASITYTKQVTVSSLYANLNAGIGFVPYYEDPYFADSIISYNSIAQEIIIGGVASFKDGNDQAIIGNETATTGFVKVETNLDKLTLAGSLALEHISLSATGGVPTLHLPIRINGTSYKIQLLTA
jgi:hypothetical protein